MKGEIKYLQRDEAINFLLPRHYSGRIPQISQAFGWFIDGKLVAVCSFGKPASHSLCIGICGKEHAVSVYELNRVCRIDELNEPLSSFVAACLRRLKNNNWIIVSYADTDMNHNGYLYQACNFIYTGKTKSRTDQYTPGNKHSRHANKAEQGSFRKIRTAKHRYVFFCSNDKKLLKQWRKSLRYEIQSYPKGENKNYILGQIQKPQLIQIERKS